MRAERLVSMANDIGAFFNAEADKVKGAVILCVSADLPFALKRFCGAEGLEWNR